MGTPTDDPAEPCTIRPATAGDEAVALRLFREDLESLGAGLSLEHEDLHDLTRTYLEPPDGGFWIAEAGGRAVGMIGVLAGTDHTAELRRLRVDVDHRRRGVGARLFERALAHCRERGLLRISLEVLENRRPAIGLFEKTGFRLNRERRADGRVRMDFYVDLYRQPTD